MRLEQFLDRTAALDRAKAKAKAMRVEQARKMGLRARALSEVTMRQPPKASAIDWGLPTFLEVLTVSAHFVPLSLRRSTKRSARVQSASSTRRCTPLCKPSGPSRRWASPNLWMTQR
jgi:hypothetical protein